MILDNEFVTLEFNNGILIADYNAIFIDITIANVVLLSREQFTKERPLPMLLNTSKLKGIDKESRDFFSQPEGSAGLTAVAVLVNSTFSKWLANFALAINFKKNSIPIKVYTNKQDAIKWLTKYINEE